jgi:hypothetical protein
MTTKEALLDKLHELHVSVQKGRNATGLVGVTEESLRQLLDRLAEEFRGLTDMVWALPDAETDLWRKAVVEACVINHLSWDDAEPNQTLMKLVDWEIRTVLDPAVSGDAQALIDKGRVLGIGEAIQAVTRYQWLEEHADIESVFHDDRVSIKFPVADSLEAGFESLAELVDAGVAAQQRQAEQARGVEPGLLGDLGYVPGALDGTAPGQIWLQVSTDVSNNQRQEVFPNDPGEVSWCAEPVGGLEIRYVRADLAHRHRRSMGSAPRDGTPVLLEFKASDALPERMAGFGGRWFVGRYADELTEWCFAAPAGHSGISSAWLAGWLPAPGGIGPEPSE